MNDLGSFEVGKKAEIILVDLKRLHNTLPFDIYSTIVYSSIGSDVDTVIVNGRIVMERGSINTVDERRLIEMAEDVAAGLYEKIGLKEFRKKSSLSAP